MATIDIKYFGMIAESLSKDSEKMELESFNPDLRSFFEARYPELKNMSYQIAVDHELRDSINENEDKKK